jgi:hypothetical protein
VDLGPRRPEEKHPGPLPQQHCRSSPRQLLLRAPRDPSRARARTWRRRPDERETTRAHVPTPASQPTRERGGDESPPRPNPKTPSSTSLPPTFPLLPPPRTLRARPAARVRSDAAARLRLQRPRPRRGTPRRVASRRVASRRGGLARRGGAGRSVGWPARPLGRSTGGEVDLGLLPPAAAGCTCRRFPPTLPAAAMRPPASSLGFTRSGGEAT